MEKKDVWVALFSQKPKAGVNLEEALPIIVGDKEPDADADAAFDDATRERIQDFLMDPNAFIQANASDPRVPFWNRMVPAPAPVQQIPARTTVSAPAPIQTPAAAPVTLPTCKAGLSPNALAAAARAATAPPVTPTLSLGNVPAPLPAPAVTASPSAAPVVTPVVAASTAAAAVPATVSVSVSPQTTARIVDPITLTERAIVRLILQGKSPPKHLRGRLRAEAIEVEQARCDLELETAEKKRRLEDEAQEVKRAKDAHAAEQQRRLDEEAADRRVQREEAAAERKSRREDEQRLRKQAEPTPEETSQAADRAKALAKARQVPQEVIAIITCPVYKARREELVSLALRLRDQTSTTRTQDEARFGVIRAELDQERDGEIPEVCRRANHLVRLVLALRDGFDRTDKPMFDNLYVTGRYNA